MSSTNVRARGKIRRDEWPRISERFHRGETLTEIARSYGCTSPAIRYILGRMVNGSASRTAAFRAPEPPAFEPDAERGARAQRATAPAQATGRHGAVPMSGAAVSSASSEIWSRINNDIATFLAAMDALFAGESDRNYESLLKATDRLLWASARTRLELERVLAERKVAGPRRRGSAASATTRNVAA
jgi:hypothetical protein